MIAALYVEAGGVYFGLPGVDPWDEARDARNYAGPHPVVAHPPCQRWGRFWAGGPAHKGPPLKMGDDGWCFGAALDAVRRWGGVLEHPEGSHAWRAFGLNLPPRSGGWVTADFEGGWTCCVEQGHYGHLSRKPTWLYAARCGLPSLIWGPSPQRIHPRALELHGYEKARRIGAMAMVGGKDKTRIRNATPPEFRDLLIGMARSGKPPLSTERGKHDGGRDFRRRNHRWKGSGMSKELYIKAHEDLQAEYLGRHPNASEGEAYEKTADLAYDRMIDRLADMADDLKTRRREGL